MENLTYQPSAEHVAACGLYCGACRKFVKGQCPGCKANTKAESGMYKKDTSNRI